MLAAGATAGRGGYWTTFFPAVVVLGLGMAVSVAPLTTTVMNAVDERRAGIASGVNNAVSRAAGLLAVAALGLVMLHAFNRSLDPRLSSMNLAAETQRAIDQERVNLGGAKVPRGVDPQTRIRLRRAISDSFVTGFRQVMLIAAGLALLNALVSRLLIQDKKSSSRSA